MNQNTKLAFRWFFIVALFYFGYRILMTSSDATENSQDKISVINNTSISRQTAITQAIEIVSPAVVGIHTTQLKKGRTGLMFDPFWGGFFPKTHMYKVESLGSGAIISSDGYVVTNTHVVANAHEIVITLTGGKQYSAEVIGFDMPTDIALLKIKGNDFPFVKFGKTDNLIVGEWVIAIGNPLGLFDIANIPTATAGIISGLHLDFGAKESGHIYQNMIQTDASINQGNSGGPLVNVFGDVIGINTFIISGSNNSTGSIGIGFAIPANRVQDVITDLINYGQVDRSFHTGIKLQSIDTYIQKYLQLPSTDGVLITQIESESAGESAGLWVGDIILKVDGNNVNSGHEILRIIEEGLHKSGDYIELNIMREGKTINIKLELK